MPRTVLGKAQRFTVRGNGVILWIPRATMPDGIFDAAAKTATVTVELQNAVAAVSGFSLSQADLPAPDWGSLQTGQVPGEITTEGSSMTFYLDKTGADVRTVLVTGDDGFIIIAEAGLVTGGFCDVYEATVKYGAKVREDIARITIPFSIATGVQENVVIPADV